ncbi:DNA cytosine methyltransferase [Sulfurovum riftiae]|uniref:Cytosine-specific methyltransferase n=1 Tax=Sulfurovum riftiae TaxID=1630136 RepID=A0A151CJ37_9BACT|nr:DNA cytosine methyltransferase [Sulfurovum riftiae]KYJ87550.1 cytosine methyltransferase [Sulfurovum riftiae]
MVVLDLFSGAGGLSEGFWRAGAKFAAHVEADKYACETLKTRAAYWALKKSDNLDLYCDYLLGKVTRDELWSKSGSIEKSEVIHKAIGKDTYSDIVKQIHTNMDENRYQNIDVLIGGPPCQAYSLIGRSRMGEKVHNDHRNYLFEFYIDFLHKFKPKIFVFENVPGLKNAGGGKYYEMLMKALRKEYDVPEPEIHNAAEYGVLQNRKRFLIIGCRKNCKLNMAKFAPKQGVNPFDGAIVGDLLHDLPPIKPGQAKNGKGAYSKSPSEYLKKSGIREDSFNILTHHIARPHNDRDREIYKIVINKWNQENHKLKYSDLPKRLINHKNTKSFLDRFNVIKSNKSTCQTMVAHIAKDGHYFIHPDEKQARSLSVREAARIQSFPDDFYFEGPRTAIFTQIGNAVPPLMSEQIAKKIEKLL